MSEINELIDKQDGFEIVRNQIGAILATEIKNQQVLATNANKNPQNWKIRVFSEASNPWEQYIDADVKDKSPLVNVWYESSNFEEAASTVVERQKTVGIFNLDCYGFAIAEDVPTGGHSPGDKEAAFQVQKTIRLVRNILMSAQYTYLGLRGLVWQRWPQSITVFQPQLDGQFVQQIVGARIAFRVIFNEFSPQYPVENLEYVSVEVDRTENGELLVGADYDYNEE
jgi:hypothetical protein